ncbi:MAG: hypothetical protein ACPGQL_10350 [Thermoplasmatota archaeon]
MIRGPTEQEEAAIVGFFDGMRKTLAKRVVGDQALVVIEEQGAVGDDGITAVRLLVALASPATMALPEALRVDATGGTWGGLVIGELEEDEDGLLYFTLDIQGAVAVGRLTDVQSVRVTERSARLVLYRRPVLGSSVEGFDPRLNRGDACIIRNPRSEAIAIGEVVGRFKGNRPAVNVLHDLGTYLRDQTERAKGP